MADEATVRTSLMVQKSSDADSSIMLIDYIGRPQQFSADITGIKGPCVGSVTVTTYGTSIDLSEMTTPGLCRLMNQDDENYVEYGIYDPQIDVFYPLGEILPGESYVIRFSRNIQEEYDGTGTGTTGPTNAFRLKANRASVNVLVEAFEA